MFTQKNAYIECTLENEFLGGAELQSFGERDEWREKELKKEGRKEEPQKYESWKRKAQK